MKFLLASDSPTSPTGMANQMRFIAKHLAKRKHEFDYLGWQNVLQHEFEDDPIKYTVYPALSNSQDQSEIFGKKKYPFYYELLKPDVVMTLGDAWMVDQMPQYPYNPLWIMYFPVDGHPLNKNIRDTVAQAHVPVAMSKFGQMVCKQAGLEVDYIPHQINWKRLSKYGKKSKRKKMREKYFPDLNPETLILGSIARNNPRKHHMRLLRAFEIFIRENELTPDDVRLYLHLDPKDAMMHTRLNAHDYFFIEWVDTLHLDDYIIYPDTEGYNFATGVSDEELYERMSCLDIHVNATGGEGFGVPTVETMAMGIPQIITNYTTSEELISHKNIRETEIEEDFTKHRGILVPFSRLYMENSNVNKAWIDVGAMADAFSLYYNDRELMELHGANAKTFSKQYDNKEVNKMWDELIARIPKIEVVQL